MHIWQQRMDLVVNLQKLGPCQNTQTDCVNTWVCQPDRLLKTDLCLLANKSVCILTEAVQSTHFTQPMYVNQCM